MATELVDLSKTAAPKMPAWLARKWFTRPLPSYLATPMQRRKMQSTAREAIRRPLREVPGFLGKRLTHLVRQGAKSGFKERGLARVFHTLAIAEPAIMAYQLRKHPEQFKGRKGREIGESVGLSAAYLAGLRLPLAGTILAAAAGKGIGGAIGSVAD